MTSRFTSTTMPPKKKQRQECPSVVRARMLTTMTHTASCAWPAFYCPHTPSWQLFSSCMHKADRFTASCWRSLRGPFTVPFGIHGHEFTWEKMDDHMAGCTLCGKVHRCDTAQCEEILPGEPGFARLNSQMKFGVRCPIQHMEDSSIVCTCLLYTSPSPRD